MATKDIELCICYTTSGFPDFKPRCNRGHRASLKCHSINPDCPDYRQSCENVGRCATTEDCRGRSSKCSN